MTSGRVPSNELDQAIVALGRSQAALPRFMRALGAGKLWFLTPYHPEVEDGEIELEPGMRSPFVELEDAAGAFVPIFSSGERLDEALRTAQAPPGSFAAGSMDAAALLEVLARMELRVVLNRGCSTGQVELPRNLMSDVADGSAFEVPPMDGPAEQQTLTMIDPADFPTDLIQPVFEFVRQHENFRALWIFHHGEGKRTPAGGLRYQFVAHMEPRDAALYHDFQLVLASACKAPHEAASGCVNEGDAAYLAALWKLVKPFYVAVGHQPPPAAA